MTKATPIAGCHPTGAQRDVIAFLEAPASYSPPVADVTRIDTHAALVFLAGDRAYKLKREIKLPYLDFSTIEKRRVALQRELEINARITPELYLAVLPITCSAGALKIGGEGPPVDWVLIMRRFDESALLDVQASRGEIPRDIIPQLASEIENFHRSAPPVKDGAWISTLIQIVSDLEGALCGSHARAAGLRLRPCVQALRQELARQIPLLRKREQEGYVRHCHGDLHLKNIIIWEGRPRLFDALEFSDELATIDVFYDLAFLLMDFCRRDLKAEANGVFNHYLQKATVSELASIALLPLFLSLRAAIRAMTGVHGLPFKESHAKDAAISEISSYGALAASLLEKQPSRLIAIGGLSGTGKTVASRNIAPFIGAVPGAVHLRTDVERKIMFGVTLDAKLPASAYDLATSAEVYRRVCEKAEAVLSAGQSAIIDAVFPEGAARCPLRDIAKRTKATFEGIWLEAQPEQLRERVSKRTGDASDADVSVVDRQLQTVNAPRDWTRIDASHSPEATAAKIINNFTAPPCEER